MRVAGVDLGKRKAAVSQFLIQASGEVELLNVVSLMVHPTQRAHELASLIGMVLSVVDRDDYVFVEEPLVGRGVKASMDISQTAGALLAGLGQLEIHTELVNVKTWKKRVVGNGNASKEVVSMWLEETHPSYAADCGEDQDAKDACCIGLFGVSTVLIVRDMDESRRLPESPA